MLKLDVVGEDLLFIIVQVLSFDLKFCISKFCGLEVDEEFRLIELFLQIVFWFVDVVIFVGIGLIVILIVVEVLYFWLVLLFVLIVVMVYVVFMEGEIVIDVVLLSLVDQV